MTWRRPVCLLLALLLVLPAYRAVAQVAYEVDLVGVEDEELRELIAAESLLIAQRERPPASLVGLRRRAEADIERVREILRSRGYYGVETRLEIQSNAEPVRVTLRVSPGPVYTLSTYEVTTQRPAEDAPPIVIDMDVLGLEEGQPAAAADIVAAEDRLLVALAQRGYPLAVLESRRVVVDRAAETVAVELLVDTGPFARFGPALFEGLDDVEEDFARGRIVWEPGQPFDLRLLEQARRSLIETELFSAVRLSPADELDEQGRLPVTVTVQERPFRSIGGSVSYDTSQGPGATVFWEHRNLGGDGERARVEGFYRPTYYGASAAGTLPDIGIVGQDFVADVAATREVGEGFTVTSVAAGAGLQRRLGRYWRVGAGARLQREIEKEDGQTETFNLLSFPVRANRDSTDDVLDPTSGGRLSVEVEPFRGITGTDIDFTRVLISDSIYVPLTEEGRIVLAGFGQAGTIFQADLDEVPADRRFYAGGGGSVRAFGFQLAGPIGADGDPTGGLSLLVAGAELRARATDTIGGVVFLEGGTVFQDRIPDLSEEILWGAGVGVRYYSPIGPVRLDVATPLNPREGIDDSYQFYISIGQAF